MFRALHSWGGGRGHRECAKEEKGQMTNYTIPSCGFTAHLRLTCDVEYDCEFKLITSSCNTLDSSPIESADLTPKLAVKEIMLLEEPLQRGFWSSSGSRQIRGVWNNQFTPTTSIATHTILREIPPYWQLSLHSLQPTRSRRQTQLPLISEKPHVSLSGDSNY